MPAVLSLAFLIVYALTFTAAHRFDAVAFVIAARNPDPRAWFNPHHLLYVWLGHVLMGVVGPDHLVRALQGVSAVAAAVCLWIYASVLQRLVDPRHRVWPLLAVALLGLSASFWVSAVETDPYALTLASLAAAVAGYLRASDGGTLRWHVIAGIVAALGTLVHQMMVLFALAYVLALGLVWPRRRWAPMLAFVMPMGLLTGTVYLTIGYVYGFFHDPASLLAWLTTYAHQGSWGPPNRSALVEGLYGFLYSVAGGGGGLVPTAAVRAVAALVLLGCAWMGVRLLRTLEAHPSAHRRRTRVVAMGTLAVCGLAIYVPFILCYAAFYTPHWQFVTMLLLILAVCGADRVGGVARAARRRALVGAVALVCVTVGLLNYVRVIAPLTAGDPEGTLARHALARMPAGARVVAPIGAATLLMIEGLGGEAVFIVPHRPGEHERVSDVLRRLQAFIERSLREDHPVWVFASLMEPPSDGYLGDAAFRRAIGDALRGIAGDGLVVVIDTRSLRGAPRAL